VCDVNDTITHFNNFVVTWLRDDTHSYLACDVTMWRDCVTWLTHISCVTWLDVRFWRRRSYMRILTQCVVTWLKLLWRDSSCCDVTQFVVAWLHDETHSCGACDVAMRRDCVTWLTHIVCATWLRDSTCNLGDEDPSRFRSRKTMRGPLKRNWQVLLYLYVHHIFVRKHLMYICVYMYIYIYIYIYICICHARLCGALSSAFGRCCYIYMCIIYLYVNI